MPDHCYWWITNLTYTHTSDMPVIILKQMSMKLGSTLLSILEVLYTVRGCECLTYSQKDSVELLLAAAWRTSRCQQNMLCFGRRLRAGSEAWYFCDNFHEMGVPVIRWELTRGANSWQILMGCCCHWKPPIPSVPCRARIASWCIPWVCIKYIHLLSSCNPHCLAGIPCAHFCSSHSVSVSLCLPVHNSSSARSSLNRGMLKFHCIRSIVLIPYTLAFLVCAVAFLDFGSSCRPDRLQRSCFRSAM